MAVEDKMAKTVRKSVSTANDVLLLDKLVKVGFKYDDDPENIEDDISAMIEDVREWKKLLKMYLKQVGDFQNEDRTAI